MRKRTRKIGVLLLNSILSFNMTGCLKINDEIRSNDFFTYAIVRQQSNLKYLDQPYIIITGFKEYERIDIPREIDGYPVRQIGRYYGGYLSFTCAYPLEYPNTLQRMFFYDNIKRIENIINFDESQLIGFYCSHVLPPVEVNDFKRLYIYCDVYNSTYDYLPGELDFDGKPFESFFYPANITFMNNYPLEDNDDKYYRLDNVENDEKLIEPPAPELEGYTFTGWYTEEECIYKYDFNTTLDIELGDEMVLYAGWEVNE